MTASSMPIVLRSSFSWAALYTLQAIFYASNYWSLGLFYSTGLIVSMALLAAPLFAFLWLHYMGRVFQITGKWLGGNALRTDLRAAVAQSKIPILFFVPLWFYFIFVHSKHVFILGATYPSPILINGLSLFLGFISQSIRVQAIRKLQSFSLLRAAFNAAICLLISSFIFFFLIAIVRFIYPLWIFS